MRNVLLFFTILLSLSIHAQIDSINIKEIEEKSNKTPIIFGELIFGGARNIDRNGGFLLGTEINYQHQKSLFSFRYLEILELEYDVILLSPITPFPIITEKSNHKEFSILYGRRWIDEGSSISFSGGISTSHFERNLLDSEGDNYTIHENFIGFPFELNFKWFKKNKSKYRIYYLIPVGQPTSFGKSFGFKLVGNLSKNSFVGLGLVYGLGIHKEY